MFLSVFYFFIKNAFFKVFYSSGQRFLHLWLDRYITAHHHGTWPAYLMRLRPFLARLVFSDEKTCCSMTICWDIISMPAMPKSTFHLTVFLVTHMYSCSLLTRAVKNCQKTLPCKRYMHRRLNVYT